MVASTIVDLVEVTSNYSSLRQNYPEPVPQIKQSKVCNSVPARTFLCKISVEIYRELDGKKPYLKAVSFLGAAIPQVKGMDNVEFKEAESDVYVFEVDNPAEDFKDEVAKISEKMSTN